MDKFIKHNSGLGFVGIGYQMGSTYETEGLYGISHLMEHLGCKPFDELLPKIKRLSITDNAYTSDNKLVFWFAGRERTLHEVVPEVAHRIMDVWPIWTEEAFLNERETVLQEYMDTFNSQESGFYENIMRRHYGHFGPIGRKTDIENFTYADSVLLAKKNFGRPHFLAQVGERRVLNLELFCDTTQLKILKYKEDGYDVEEEEVPKSDKTVVGLLGKHPISLSAAPLINFVTTCLNDGLESPLYQEIRELRGLSYFSLNDLNVVGRMFIPFFMATTTNERAEELKEVYFKFFSGDLSRHISQDRFNDCKEYFLGKKEMSEILAHSGAGPALLKDFDKFEGIERWKYSDVLECLEMHFGIDKFKMLSH